MMTYRLDDGAPTLLGHTATNREALVESELVRGLIDLLEDCRSSLPRPTGIWGCSNDSENLSACKECCSDNRALAVIVGSLVGG
jgi:hypothetical protein